MQKLKTYFQAIGFTGESLEAIVSAFDEQTVKKNDLFVEEGKVSRCAASTTIMKMRVPMVWRLDFAG
jgi:hypothetical protein